MRTGVRMGIAWVQHPSLAWQTLLYNVKRIYDDLRARIGLYKYDHKIIFIAGMGQGGTTWVKQLLGRIPGYYTRKSPMDPDENYKQEIADSYFKFAGKNNYTLYKTHINPTQENINCIRRNGVNKVVVSYRDLRDVAVSRYHRFIAQPKEKTAFDYVDYVALGKEKSISHSIKVTSEEWGQWVLGWKEIAKQYPNFVHFVRFEDLKKDTRSEFVRMLDFYDIQLSGPQIDYCLMKGSKKKSTNQTLETSGLVPWAYSTNFRKGGSEYWKDECTSAQIQDLKDRMGSMLIELGYESDLDW